MDCMPAEAPSPIAQDCVDTPERSHRPVFAAWLFAALAAASTLLMPTAAFSQDAFVAFETGQVRPLALSPDGSRLFATNTPDNRLEIFRVTADGLVPESSVTVGLEPVSVAVLDGGEVWVVNHLSDSVSVVEVPDDAPPRVARTLQVGDEPRDIVFAGPANDLRAFITTAHRGQNSPLPYRPFESEGRADVWVFDADGSDDPLTIVTLFGDTPRPLAVSPDRRTVYAGIMHSGNRTTIISDSLAAVRPLPPLDNVDGVPAPRNGLIVRQYGDRWLDAGGRDWTPIVRVELPDYDVFAIDAMAAQPVETNRVSGVGTTLLNIAVNPRSGRLYVSNLEALNHVRFEGAGEYSGGETVRGHFVENRISVVQMNGRRVLPRHLNKHIDYDSFPGTPAENDASLATPTAMVVTPDGRTLYVAAFGSSKIGRFDTRELERDTFTPDPSSHIELTGGGPSGLVLDPGGERLYVLTRFNNAIATIDLNTQREVASVAMFNPEPEEIVEGRRFLYDARYTSSRGDSSCGNCHIFGDVDHLAWDLGDPDLPVIDNPNPPRPGLPEVQDFHPLKGPLTTQSLRGMDTHGAMHWRGDRTGGNDPESGDPFDERAAFRAFNVAFEGLLGRTAPLTRAEMDAFTDFALRITYPPNPIRALDNSLTRPMRLALNAYETNVGSQGQTCNGCHVRAPEDGFFGTAGFTSGVAKPMKVPHLRNLYTKVGFIGRPGPGPSEGPSIRGFAYSSEGSVDTLPFFLSNFEGHFSPGPRGEVERQGMVELLLAFDSNLAPIVGQQETLVAPADTDGLARVDLLRQRAMQGECDLVGKATLPLGGGEERGFVMTPAGTFQTDRRGQVLSLQQLIDLGEQLETSVTFTCVPPGSGTRIGIDRDLDGIFDGDEVS